ncbi:heat-inducible transcription repressor HrcA [Syntrophotalea acetylenivorans]|uniref:Heat-inducible transcription repressor HrcA n=1 Tax=Syntrophotalea acetylenivorans TaxID=1842532 RepID=A0A1L3GQM1_9BACT|nr:heat-inducible transcriptional repressor HrcA [Syntrophotalea acetylenivorans]APG28242.1 heat-inducible transcription repressor HrcA [Syntrophotalea acetylenivorans]
MSEELSERSRLILQAIIEDYTTTGEPVGSRTLSRRTGINLSPASVRNVMADLEELGYLYSPHTSAGRIPTDKGYRFYVASLLRVQQLSHEVRDHLRRECQVPELDTEGLLREAGRILSATSNYTGLVMVPRFTSTVFRRIEFVRLAEQRVLVVFITQTGIVQHKLVEVDVPLTQGELDEVTNYLNQEFSGLSIQEIKSRIASEMAQEQALFDSLQRRALLLSSYVLQLDLGGQVFVEGASNILEQPEFADLSTMKRLLRTFDQKSLLVELLDKAQQVEGVQILIGSADNHSEIEGCSLVTSCYSSRRGTTGILGVIGPTRMPYAMVIPLVDYAASLVSDILNSESE